MNRIPRLAATLAAALLLASCTVTIGPGPDPEPSPFEGAPTIGVNDDRSTTVDGTVTPTPVRSDDAVVAGEPNYYVVQVPDARDQALIYIEAYDAAGAPLVVEVFGSPDGDAELRSDSPVTFTDAAGAATVRSDLAAQQIVRRGCEGPCAITANESDRLYVRVSTRSEVTVDYSLFVYDAAHDEESEPDNDDCLTTTATVGDGGSYFGAVETLGDFDCILHTGDATSVEINWVGQSEIVELDVSVVTSSRSYRATVSAANPTATVTTPGPIQRIEIEGSAGAAGPPVGSSYSVFF